MSQRLRAGFNAPDFSFFAGDGVELRPVPPSALAWSVSECPAFALLFSVFLLPLLLLSPMVGVAHPASFACRFRLVRLTPSFFPFSTAFLFRSKNCSGVPPASCAAGVAHPASAAAACPANSSSFFLAPPRDTLPPASVVGVAHPEQSLSEVRRPRPRSAQIGGPDGIAQCFQVSTYSSEPFTSKR
jgi:hypothetical protein